MLIMAIDGEREEDIKEGWERKETEGRRERMMREAQREERERRKGGGSGMLSCCQHDLSAIQ